MDLQHSDLLPRLIVAALGSLLIAPVVAFAQSNPADGEDFTHTIDQLVFFPVRGQFRASIEAQTSLNDSGSATNDVTGVQINSSNHSLYNAICSLQYGLSDSLRLGISETYLFSQTSNTTNATTGVQTNVSSSGESDPTLNLTYRYVRKVDSDLFGRSTTSTQQGFFADASLSVTPDLAARMTPQTTQSGNDFAGGWSSSLTLPFYFVANGHELELAPQFDRNFGVFAHGSPATADSSSTPYWNESLTVADRYHVSKDFYVQVSLPATFGSSYSTTSQAVSAKTNQLNTSFKIAPALNLGYLINPWALVYAIVSYTSSSSSTTPSTGVQTDSSSTETLLSLGAIFRF